MNNIKELLGASYGNKKDEEQLINKGYKKDSSLSGKRVKVYTDEEGNPIITHRGTASIKDFMTDAYISLGGDIKKTDRYKFSKKVSDETKNKYKDKKITQVGHSLGGKLAETTANNNDDIITYNKAAVLSDIGKKRKPNQLDIRHKNDVVSFISNTQKGGKTKTIKNNTNNFLSAHNLKNLKFI